MSETIVITCPKRGSRVVVLAGEPGTAGGGVGGTSTLDLPWSTAAVHWETHPPDTLAVPIVFDGFAQRRSVEPQIATLQTMARARGGEKRPPAIYLDGPVPAWSVAAWLVESIEWGAAVRPEDGSVYRLRQEATLNLVSDRQPELALTRPRRRSSGQSRTHRWRSGDTPSKVAQAERVHGGAPALKRANPRIRDWRHVRPGTVIKLPR